MKAKNKKELKYIEEQATKVAVGIAVLFIILLILANIL